MQAGFLLVTRPWNGGPPATLRVTPLAADSPAPAGAASPTAHSPTATGTEILQVAFMPSPFRIGPAQPNGAQGGILVPKEKGECRRSSYSSSRMVTPPGTQATGGGCSTT